MSVQESFVARTGARDHSRVAPALFAVALFSSAFLLFWIEPLFARMLLPRLGGSQAVWNTCLVFFQASLLVGYTYAYAISRLPTLRLQVLLHLAFVAGGCVFLPVAISPAWSPGSSGSPVFAVFALLASSLGWPFVALSASAPLLQHWFASSGERNRNPFILYAVSNAGSLLSLLAYPFVVEPNLSLPDQSGLWTYCYVALACAIGAAGLIAISTARQEAAAAPDLVRAGVCWKQRFTWTVYAAFPSSLLIGVTGYVTTDIASFPFLWILPLSLYLLTFVLSFAARPPLDHALAIRLLPIAVLFAAVGFWIASFSLVAGAAIQFGAFFLIALACHGELARTKPPAASLTEFYFWISLGGVIGGALTALVSPLLFNDFVEYPLALALLCLLKPGEREGRFELRNTLLIAAVFVVVAQPLSALNATLSWTIALGAIAIVASFALTAKPRSALLLTLALFLALHTERVAMAQHGETIWKHRSFYGVYAVTEDRRAGYRIMFHGPTLHGVERIGAGTYEPLTYYARGGPLGDVMRAVGDRSREIGVIGLGIGSTGCYAQPGQSWTFYELDGVVDQIARKSGLFGSMSTCAPNARVVLGDGRLNLSHEGANLYDLLMLDAFSSDAIPVHLLTREAFATYARALRQHGVLAIHITNRHFDLAPVIARAATEAGFVTYERRFSPPAGGDLALLAPSRWMALALDSADLAGIASDPNWKQPQLMPGARVWTDDYSNILAALR